MPIVFVHGVSNRSGVEYQRHKTDRDKYLKMIAFRQADGRPYSGRVIEGFWGDLGAKVEGGLRSLPGEHVAFGSVGEATVDELRLAGLGDEFLAELASVAPADALDLLFAAITANFADADAPMPDELIRFAQLAASVVEKLQKRGQGLDARTNDQVIAVLVQLVEAAERRSKPKHESGYVALGNNNNVGFLQNGLNRLTGAVNVIAGAAGGHVSWAGRRVGLGVLARKRTPWSGAAALFLGDAFVYLASRGTPQQPGDIPMRIAERLQEGLVERKPPEERLVVIGHSLGGVILYDLLSGFLPLIRGLEIDVLVTVGSQVGVFAELGLYVAQDGKPSLDPGKTLARPAGVHRWINVYDLADVFAFQAKPLFGEEVEDYNFSSKAGILSAHSAYFSEPVFYERLAARLISRREPRQA